MTSLLLLLAQSVGDPTPSPLPCGVTQTCPKQDVEYTVRLAEGAEVRSGDVELETVEMAFKRQRAALRRCYEVQLWQDPAVQGEIVFDVVFDDAGAPTQIEVVESDVPDKLRGCARHVLWRLALSPPQGPAAVRVPVRFERD